jgi:hypothetical protein
MDVSVLNAVDSTGVSKYMIDKVKTWREWLEFEDDEQWLRFYFCLDYLGCHNDSRTSRRDAEYVVECLRVVLCLENNNPRKTTMMSLAAGGLTDEAISVLCHFLQQPNNTRGLMVLRLHSREGREDQYRRLLES